MFRMPIKLLRNMGIIKENSTTVNMCKGTEGIYNDGVECGREQGREELIINAMKSGSTAEEIAVALRLDLMYVLRLREEMHIDMEHILYDDGSAYADIYGGNIMIDEEKPVVVWQGHPNIERNKVLGGRGRLLTDEKTITELTEILTEWIK